MFALIDWFLFGVEYEIRGFALYREVIALSLEFVKKTLKVISTITSLIECLKKCLSHHPVKKLESRCSQIRRSEKTACIGLSVLTQLVLLHQSLQQGRMSLSLSSKRLKI